MPANTFLLLSTVSDESTVFEQLDSAIRHYYNDRIIVTDIQPLNHSELDQMTESYLLRHNRTLQPEQRASLTKFGVSSGHFSHKITKLLISFVFNF